MRAKTLTRARQAGVGVERVGTQILDRLRGARAEDHPTSQCTPARRVWVSGSGARRISDASFDHAAAGA